MPNSPPPPFRLERYRSSQAILKNWQSHLCLYEPIVICEVKSIQILLLVTQQSHTDLNISQLDR